MTTAAIFAQHLRTWIVIFAAVAVNANRILTPVSRKCRRTPALPWRAFVHTLAAIQTESRTRIQLALIAPEAFEALALRRIQTYFAFAVAVAISVAQPILAFVTLIVAGTIAVTSSRNFLAHAFVAALQVVAYLAMGTPESRRTHTALRSRRIHFACGAIVTAFLANGRGNFTSFTRPLRQTATLQRRQQLIIRRLQRVHMANAFVATVTGAPVLLAVFALVVLRTEALLFVVEELAGAAVAFQSTHVRIVRLRFARDAQLVVAHGNQTVGTFAHAAGRIARRQQTNAGQIAWVRLAWI